MPIVHENIATLNLCLVLHDFNSKNLGTHSNVMHFSTCNISPAAWTLMTSKPSQLFLSEDTTLNTSSVRDTP